MKKELKNLDELIRAVMSENVVRVENNFIIPSSDYVKDKVREFKRLEIVFSIFTVIYIKGEKLKVINGDIKENRIGNIILIGEYYIKDFIQM